MSIKYEVVAENAHGIQVLGYSDDLQAAQKMYDTIYKNFCGST